MMLHPSHGRPRRPAAGPGLLPRRVTGPLRLPAAPRPHCRSVHLAAVVTARASQRAGPGCPVTVPSSESVTVTVRRSVRVAAVRAASPSLACWGGRHARNRPFGVCATEGGAHAADAVLCRDGRRDSRNPPCSRLLPPPLPLCAVQAGRRAPGGGRAGRAARWATRRLLPPSLPLLDSRQFLSRLSAYHPPLTGASAGWLSCP